MLIGRIQVTALANPPALVEVFGETIVEELDFRLEAENMLDVARVLAATGQRSLVVPRPHPSLVTRRVLVMERLDGFSWDDVVGMHEAGVDTAAVVRAVMVSFLEGAALFGVFHGDLHGGNLFVRPDGRVALLDYGITGRLDEPRRLAFLRLLVAGTLNDPLLQLTALRDLGALPLDTDLAAVVSDLGLDQTPTDPTAVRPEELLNAVRDLTRKLLDYGARFPKVLMLFVKDLLFLDGALATLAPDVDLLSEVVSISLYFAERYGAQITAEIGIDPRVAPMDIDTVRTALALPPDVEHMSNRELQERRALIRRRLEEHRRATKRHWGRRIGSKLVRASRKRFRRG
jgi:ubiquinone biosynthesis protein